MQLVSKIFYLVVVFSSSFPSSFPGIWKRRFLIFATFLVMPTLLLSTLRYFLLAFYLYSPFKSLFPILSLIYSLFCWHLYFVSLYPCFQGIDLYAVLLFSRRVSVISPSSFILKYKYFLVSRRCRSLTIWLYSTFWLGSIIGSVSCPKPPICVAILVRSIRIHHHRHFYSSLESALFLDCLF